jgi:hypothetical protein
MASEVTMMNKEAILNQLTDGTSTRKDILKAAQKIDPTFKETQLRYLLGVLDSSHMLVREGRNQYRKAEDVQRKPVFKGLYSEKAQAVIRKMQSEFPLLEYRVWELSWLNEFFKHLVAQNTIFLEVESEGCDFVFTEFFELFPGRVLLRPKVHDIEKYGTGNGVIIDRLVTESPKGKGQRYQVPLEKLIVDLFANKHLSIPKAEYPEAIQQMFETYQIDQVSLFRYARRRNKEKELASFLKHKTSVELVAKKWMND